MAKFEEIAVVLSQKEIAKDIFDLTIQTKDIAKHARAGQFISLYCNDGTKLLPRPISLCEIDYNRFIVIKFSAIKYKSEKRKRQ